MGMPPDKVAKYWAPLHGGDLSVVKEDGKLSEFEDKMLRKCDIVAGMDIDI